MEKPLAQATLKSVAEVLSKSFLFESAREIWAKNQFNSRFPLSKLQKAWIGIYLILEHYTQDIFPPTFGDQKTVYENEIAYRESLPGVSEEAAIETAIRKPFWFKTRNYQFLKDVIKICHFFEVLGVRPSMEILELGCGTGWMAEILSLMKFKVTGTTITPNDIKQANQRIESIRIKGIEPTLQFLETPMEFVNQRLPPTEVGTYDCVYVYEALHHAYSWEDTISSSFDCLKPGGWLLICREPNLIHTWVSYRVSVLTKTHEIGMNRKVLMNHMKKTGFRTTRILKNRFSFGVKPIWIAAQK